MKKIFFICILLFATSNIFAQLNIYPNQTTVSKNSELLVWDNATVNITLDNLQNQVTDSTLNIFRNFATATSSLSFNADQFYLSQTISANTTYALSNATKKGVVSLLVYSTSAYTINFTFTGGNLYAPYNLTSFTTDTNPSYSLIQFIIKDSGNIIVLWQQSLTKIN